MRPAAGETRRSIRPGVYVVFFLFFATIVFLSHLPLVSLPYFWDEAGQFIPAALDIFPSRLLDSPFDRAECSPSRSHGISGGGVACGRLSSHHLPRFAMLLLASFAVLTTFLLAIELYSRGTRGARLFGDWAALRVAAILCPGYARATGCARDAVHPLWHSSCFCRTVSRSLLSFASYWFR